MPLKSILSLQRARLQMARVVHWVSFRLRAGDEFAGTTVRLTQAEVGQADQTESKSFTNRTMVLNLGKNQRLRLISTRMAM